MNVFNENLGRTPPPPPHTSHLPKIKIRNKSCFPEYYCTRRPHIVRKGPRDPNLQSFGSSWARESAVQRCQGKTIHRRQKRWHQRHIPACRNTRNVFTTAFFLQVAHAQKIILCPFFFSVSSKYFALVLDLVSMRESPPPLHIVCCGIKFARLSCETNTSIVAKRSLLYCVSHPSDC